MKQLLEQGIIEEVKTSQNVAYILKEKELFSITGYKVLKAQEKSLIKCEKLLYNGDIKLVYFTKQFRTLKEMIQTTDENTALSILVKLINSIIEIKNNGFLFFQYIDLSSDKIFIDKNTLDIKLIYLPVSISNKNADVFENELRDFLIAIVKDNVNLSATTIKQICNILIDRKLSLEELYKRLCIDCMGVNTQENQNVETISFPQEDEEEINPQPILQVALIESPQCILFEIEKDEYIIGKSPLSDGVVTFNKAISRKHCSIVYHDNEYFIKDLGSSNGTFLNKNKLDLQREYLLNNGDVVRLANSDMIIRIQEV